jgi:hypothetical protein
MIPSLALVTSSSTPSLSTSVVPSSTKNMAVRFVFTTYAPLDITQVQGKPNVMPTRDYVKNILPKFKGNNEITIEDHLSEFSKVIDDMEIQHEYVAMKMFVQTLEGEAHTWYKGIPYASIDGWNSFRYKFTEIWGDK